MKVGIIILNYNTASDTEQCIASIKKTTTVPYEVIIVDGGSTDNSYDILSKKYMYDRYVKLIKTLRNEGYSFGNNIGISEAVKDGCDYLLISNPDIIYYQNSIDHMCHSLVSNPDCGIIGPSCASLDQNESQLFRKIYDDKLYIFSKKPLRYFTKLFPMFNTEYNPIQKGVYKFYGMVRGCCFLISAQLFNKMNFFDDNIFLYSEEWIIAKKLQRENLLCGCDFDAKVLHKEATSTRKEGTAFQTKHLYLSSFYYMKVYNKSSRFLLYIYFMQNIIAFLLKAIKDKSYLRMLPNFVRANLKLLKSSRNINDKNNRIR